MILFNHACRPRGRHAVADLLGVALGASLSMAMSLPSPASASSLRFFGNGVNDIDRVKIQIDDPTNSLPGPPADVGATDFTIEFWIRGSLQDNSGSVSCGGGQGWINGNIIYDRDRFSQGRSFGVSLDSGRVAFGVTDQNDVRLTICGSTNVLDDQWHHVAVQRTAPNGVMSIYVDGALETSADGPNGDLSYPDNGVPGSFCNGPCTNSDPYIVIGAEKHDAGSSAPSFNGWIDELRISTVTRYSANFAVPMQPFVTDGSTAALYHFDEGSGTQVTDVSGAAGGPSSGQINFGGNPAGPLWSADTPFMTVSPGTLQLSSAQHSVVESGGQAQITVNRVGGSLGAVAVDYQTLDQTASSGADYTQALGSLSWPDGDQTPRSFAVGILDDTQIEGDEDIGLLLSNATGGAALGTANGVLTIVDDEASPSATVTFDNPSPPGSPFSLLQGVFEGIDFGSSQWRWASPFGANPTNNIYFGTRVSSRDFEFVQGPQVLLSMRVYTIRSGTLTLTDDQGQAVSQAVVPGSLDLVTTGWTIPSTIVTVTFTAQDALGIDDITYATTGATSDTTPPVVALTGPGAGSTLSGTVSVTANATDNDQVAGVRFLLDGQPLGQEDTSSPYQVTWDTLGVPDGTYTLTARARDASGNLATSAGVSVTVQNVVQSPGTLQLTGVQYSVGEAGGQVQITVDRVGGSLGAVSVDYQTVDQTASAGSDYTQALGTLSWPDGDHAPRSFTVTILDDGSFEGDESADILLSNATGGAVLGTAMGVLTIVDDEAVPSVTVTFDNPSPPGSPFSYLQGVHGDIDFGSWQWRWASPFGANPTNNIYFNTRVSSRDFEFVPGPRVLESMRVYTIRSGTLTLTDDQGQTFSQAVVPGSLDLVTTGWTIASTTVTVAFTAQDALGIDDITYQ